MNARTWISLVNLIAIVVAFTVLFALPQYSGYAFYGLLGWILVSFVLLYGMRVGRPNVQPGASGPEPGDRHPRLPRFRQPGRMVLR